MSRLSSNEKVPMFRPAFTIRGHESPVTSRLAGHCKVLAAFQVYLPMWVNAGGLGTAACCQQRILPLTHGHSISSGARSHPYNGCSTETCQGSMSNCCLFLTMLMLCQIFHHLRLPRRHRIGSCHEGPKPQWPLWMAGAHGRPAAT